MEKMTSIKAKAGVFAIGLDAYWAQFDGLEARVRGNYEKVCSKIPGTVEVIRGGLVDSYENAKSANEVFKKEQVDILFCYCATYSPSSNVLPAVAGLDVPCVVLNLQPTASEKFSTWSEIGTWLGNLSCAGAPEVTAVLLKKGLKYGVVTGSIEADPQADQEIAEWCLCAAAVKAVRSARIALFGHAFPGMMDLYVDETKFYNQIGAFTEFMELHQIKNRMNDLTPSDTAFFSDFIEQNFDLTVANDTAEYDVLCQVCAAMYKLVREQSLSAVCMHYAGETGGEYQNIVGPMNIVFSVLIGLGIPCCVEGDIKTTTAMLLLKRLTGCCATAELYGMDLEDDICLIGHSGSSDRALADRNPVLKESEVFHGKSGKGYLTQFFVRKGPVTLVALSEDQSGNYRMITAKGISEDGEILELGDTNTRVRFDMPVKEFVNRWCLAGPSHHFALTCGDYTAAVKKCAAMMNLEVIEIAR